MTKRAKRLADDLRKTDNCSMMRIGTMACPKCSHHFLRYASECPECGCVIRHKKRHKGRTRALVYSALALAMTFAFVLQIKSTEATPQPARSYSPLAMAMPMRQTAKVTLPVQVRYVVLRESDLMRSLPGPRISSAGPRAADAGPRITDAGTQFPQPGTPFPTFGARITAK